MLILSGEVLQDLLGNFENVSHGYGYDYDYNFTFDDPVTGMVCPYVTFNNLALFVTFLIMLTLATLGNFMVLFIFWLNWACVKAADVLWVSLCMLCLLGALKPVLITAHLLNLVDGSQVICTMFVMFCNLCDFGIVLLLMLISLHRCLLIVMPNRQILGSVYLGIFLVLLAIVLSLLLSIHEAQLTNYIDLSGYGGLRGFICAMDAFGHARSSVQLVQHAFAMWIPILVIIVCFIIAICKIRRMKMKRKCKVYFSFIITTLLFLLLCVPGKMFHLIDAFIRAGIVTETCNIRMWLAYAYVVAMVLECVFYAFVTLFTSLLGSLFKQRFISFFRTCCRLRA